MAALQRDRAVYDSVVSGGRTPTTFDPAAVPLEPSLLSELAQQRPELARSNEDDDLIDLGREQLFSGEQQRRIAGPKPELPERDEAEALPPRGSQSQTEGAEATTGEQAVRLRPYRGAATRAVPIFGPREVDQLLYLACRACRAVWSPLLRLSSSPSLPLSATSS